MNSLKNNFKNHVKGVCRLVIEDDKGNVITDVSQENTLNINYIWDMCRQQLIRTNAHKREISPFGGVLLTNSEIPKNAYLPCYMGNIAGFASLYNKVSGIYDMQGYPDTTEILSKDGEFTFEFKWGATKILKEFNTIWLYGGNHGESSVDGGFHGLIQVCEPSNKPPRNAILGSSGNGFVYGMYQNRIYQYKICPDINSIYSFKEIKNIPISGTIDTDIGSFETNGNYFVILHRDRITENWKISKININGDIQLTKEVDYKDLVADIACINGYTYVMSGGVLRIYKSDDLSFIKTVDFGNTIYGPQSHIYKDGSDLIIYVYDYNVTSMQTKRTDIYGISDDLSFVKINSFTHTSLAESGERLYPMNHLGYNIFYDTYSGYFYNNHIFPCTQDVIIDGGTGETLSFSKPLGYSAKIIYKIYFDFEDKDECENQKINPRVFQDMVLNMLLPSDSKTEGINSFGSFLVVDNGDNQGLTTANTPKIGFANLYSQEKSPYLPYTQGIADITGCNINRLSGILQYRYEFDYNVSNGHISHIQTSTNSMIITGMNSPDGRCYAPKRIAKFNEEHASPIINEHGHKILITDNTSGDAKAYILSKSLKNTILELYLNFFDKENIDITLNAAKNPIVLEEVNLNNQEVMQVVYIASIRKFACFTSEKLFWYDENWNFIEHENLPFKDASINSTYNVTYHGGMEDVYAIIKENDNYKIIRYNFVKKEIIWEVSDFGYNLERVEAIACDDEYLYINCKTSINTVDSYYFLTYKIKNDGLELETFNQSRQIINGSIISTRGILGKYIFLETTEGVIRNEYPEDLDKYGESINQGMFLSKSTPYITATHVLENDVEKTKDDFFEGIFQMKLI
ncbi:hypothetical protein B5E87_00265 [Massilimicrobiota sp. An142]|uniref:hypothetical protein n=1 Tax=Massilimicrobiota sp. An142 TaxID=1965564 RepID=UPI000B3865C1|nr:hypothetical protein [Massilimicrobiota sp. An142]OUQ15039.1 hypothetical protein B5E87_00265 [Massilimicrobiota sp. An142]